jgi:hypothetical protein
MFSIFSHRKIRTDFPSITTRNTEYSPTKNDDDDDDDDDNDIIERDTIIAS